MRIEGRLRAALDAYGGTHVSRLPCDDCRIPDEQRLAIRIVNIYLDATAAGDEFLNLRSKVFTERARNPGVAGVSHRASLFAFSQIISPSPQSRPPD
jgi:hypothetical protein